MIPTFNIQMTISGNFHGMSSGVDHACVVVFVAEMDIGDGQFPRRRFDLEPGVVHLRKMRSKVDRGQAIAISRQYANNAQHLRWTFNV